MSDYSECKPSETAKLVPSEIDGWEAVEPDEMYNADNLYEYINGGAEVYIAHNVKTVFARRYEKPGEPEIIVDVFDMGSSADAYGVYHHDSREGGDAGIGIESELSDNALFFWKGRWFVSIMAFDAVESAIRAVTGMGKFIADNIKEDSPKPELSDVLPEVESMVSPPHYFHIHHCLNAHYFLAEDNILNLSVETEAVLAAYADCRVLIVRYPTAGKAGRAYDGFREVYIPDADIEGTVFDENSGWISARLEVDVFIGVFDAPSREKAETMIEKTIANINKLHSGGLNDR